MDVCVCVYPIDSHICWHIFKRGHSFWQMFWGAEGQRGDGEKCKMKIMKKLKIKIAWRNVFVNIVVSVSLCSCFCICTCSCICMRFSKCICICSCHVDSFASVAHISVITKKYFCGQSSAIPPFPHPACAPEAALC